MVTGAGRWLVCLLLFGLLVAGEPNPAAENPPSGTQKSVKLTNQSPSVSFPIAPETLTSPPPILFISIIGVVNPERTPFEILVYLSRIEKHDLKPRKILVGNFSLYPPDHTSAFLLNASHAFRQLADSGPTGKPGEAEIVIEMKRIRETIPWTPIEITLAPPEWRDDKRD